MKTKYSLGDRIYTLTNYRLEKTFIGTVDEISREIQELMDVANPLPQDSEEYELYSVSRRGPRQLKVEEHKFWEVFRLDLKPREADVTTNPNVVHPYENVAERMERESKDPTKIRLGEIADDAIDNMDEPLIDDRDGDGFIYAPPTPTKRNTDGTNPTDPPKRTGRSRDEIY